MLNLEVFITSMVWAANWYRITIRKQSLEWIDSWVTYLESREDLELHSTLHNPAGSCLHLKLTERLDTGLLGYNVNCFTGRGMRATALCSQFLATTASPRLCSAVAWALQCDQIYWKHRGVLSYGIPLLSLHESDVIACLLLIFGRSDIDIGECIHICSRLRDVEVGKHNWVLPTHRSLGIGYCFQSLNFG